jgi:hypothetical protein
VIVAAAFNRQASLFDKQAANFRGLFAFCAKRADFFG